MTTSKLTLTRKLKINTKFTLDVKEMSDSVSKKEECSYITDDIYLSCYRYSLDYDYLKRNNFTHIINCAAGSTRFTANTYEDFNYLLIDIRDDPNVDIEETILKVLNFIQKANDERKDRKILIHCYEGISRAPMVLSSYLMWKYRLNKDKAISLIKEKRTCVDINLGFICQLEKLEGKLMEIV